MINVRTVMEVKKVVIDAKGYRVETSTELVSLSGAGVFITSEGHFLTCNHVVNTGKVVDVFVTQLSGETEKAEILFSEERLDLALGQVNLHGNPYASIADPRTLEVGQEVLAIGNPYGLDFSVTMGIISALNRDLGVYNMAQTDAAISPGNSGGPLFNLKGELIGINSRIISPVMGSVGLGFAVSSGQIREFLVRFRGLEKALKGASL